MIPALLEKLRATPPPGGRMLSVYLDTSPARTFGSAYLVAFEDGCRAVRSRLDPDERARFDAAAAQVRSYLADQFVPGHPGVAIFASGDPAGFFAVTLPWRPADEVTWAEEPQLEPLEQALDEYERVAVVLFDKERARLFSIFLGEIEDQRTIEDVVPGKQKTGGWFALQQTRFARHHEEHVRRHARRTVATLMTMLRTRPFDRLFLAGPDEALAVLRQQLTRPLRARLAGTLSLGLFAPDAEVLAAARQAAEEAERRDEQALVEELIEAATTPHVALGVEPTLAALSEGRVYRLFLPEGFDGVGGECPRCRRLVAGHASCPSCGEPTVPLADFAAALIDRAREQGAQIEIVSGPAAERLIEHDGLGAWTYYTPSQSTLDTGDAQ